ncbi:MAG: PQQ-binding-like beta-propeller repeat protein [Candidatus Aminicenantes bacterium]|nr:PQQ-binding-like beta-propeller repeat protein [Candidatus Aminicenantes bacterium]
MKVRFPAILAGWLCGVLVLAFTPGLRADDWPHFGYDDQMTSFAKSEKTVSAKNVRTLKLHWSMSDGYWSPTIYGVPVISRGRLITTALGRSLTAYNAKSGDFLWQSDIPVSGNAPQPVACTDGSLLWLGGTNPYTLYKIKATTGQKVWQAPIAFDLANATNTVPAVDEARNTVYIVTGSYQDGKLYALSRKTGKILWYKGQTMGGIPFKGHTVLLKNPWIFATALVKVGYHDIEKVARIRAGTKKIEMYYTPPTSDEFFRIERFAICNDKLLVVYVNSFGFSREIKAILAAYNLGSPQVVWQKTLTTSSVTGGIACDTAKNIVYVPTDPYLYAYRVKNGSQVWKYQGYDDIFTPTVANGVVYCLSDTNMYALNQGTGKVLFRYPLGQKAEGTTQVAVADGMVYFSGSGGTAALFALGLKSNPQSPGEAGR